MVIVLEDQLAVTPVGSPVGVPIPVATVVVWVIFVNAVFKHKIGEDEAALTVFSSTTFIVPVAFTVAHPPVKGIV